MEIKKLLVTAIFIIAASFLGLSCQSVKHLGEDDGNGLIDLQDDLQAIIDLNPGTEFATRMQEALLNVSEANSKRMAGQNGAAVSELQAAIGVLASAIKDITDGLIDFEEGLESIDELIDDLMYEIKELDSTP